MNLQVKTYIILEFPFILLMNFDLLFINFSKYVIIP